MNTKLLINGKLVAGKGAKEDVLDPATGQPLVTLAEASPEQIESAVSAAAKAFPAWSASVPRDRAALLLKIAERIESEAADYARLESQNCGKPYTAVLNDEIPAIVDVFRFFAGAARTLHGAVAGEYLPGFTSMIRRDPVGVVASIAPWNYPLMMAAWKLSPALAGGNTIVLKPSEQTPLTTLKLATLLAELFPPGVVNIVHGPGASAGRALTSHPKVPLISFTGGTKTGADVMAQAGPLFKKVSLELGGKNPNIVFADADLEQAVATSISSSFSNQGEICLCGSRLFVERTIYDEFLDRFLEGTKKLRIGDPQDASTDVGALVSEPHLRKVEGYVALAKEEGGSILVGGKRPEGLPERVRGGYFLEPTVIAGLHCQQRVMQEEIFGPVVTVTPFDSPEEAIADANSTRYGLSASVWTRDLQKAHRVAAAIECGTVWVNTWLLRDLRVPFGGMKESGVGREGGVDSLHFFTEAKNVCVKL